MTNYYELYRKYGLPLEEAYYLAEFNYHITRDSAVKGMVMTLRKEIRHTSIHNIDENDIDICRKFMTERGYYDIVEPFVFQSSCNIYANNKRPDNQKIRNNVNYLKMYRKGLVSLREAYVLAKNKNFLFFDSSMLGMIFSIENEIFEDMILNKISKSSDRDSIMQTIDVIEKHINRKPRVQIRGCSESIGWLMEFYMNEEGYTYDNTACNSFIPIIKQKQ